MREIEFRGKEKKSNEWLEGQRCTNGREVWIVYDEDFCKSTSCREDMLIAWRFEEVIPETVGQYTGLKDKNGVEIFEGDIVKFTEFYNWNGKERHTGVVCWRDCCYQINSSAVFELKDIHTQDHEFEIIGNIHDNPELLKGE